MRIEEGYLLFASFDAPRVDVLPLEGGEVELTGAGVVAVRTSKQDRYPQIFEDPKGPDGGVVPGIVQHNNRILSPVWPLLVEDSNEAVEEDLHNLGVGVRLHEAEVYLASGINASYH